MQKSIQNNGRCEHLHRPLRPYLRRLLKRSLKHPAGLYLPFTGLCALLTVHNLCAHLLHFNDFCLISKIIINFVTFEKHYCRNTLLFYYQGQFNTITEYCFIRTFSYKILCEINIFLVPQRYFMYNAPVLCFV